MVRVTFLQRGRVGLRSLPLCPWISRLVGEGQLAEDDFSQGVHLYPDSPSCQVMQGGCGQGTPTPHPPSLPGTGTKRQLRSMAAKRKG